MKLASFDRRGTVESFRRLELSNTESGLKDAASGRGGSVCKLPPDEDLNRRGGVESPEGQVKTSLSLSLSLVSPCYVNTCVFCCSLSPLRTKGCARCLLNEYYQSSEGGCCRRSAWRGEAVQEEFRGRGIPWSARLPRWEHALDRRKDPFGFRRAFQKTGGNRWTNSFREEGSNIFITIIGIKGIFRCLKIFSIVSRWISWRYFSRKLDNIILIIIWR